MKQLISILILCMAMLTVSAADQRLTRINQIKKSREYLYSDITANSQDDATSLAYNQLQQEIISWAANRADGKRGTIPLPKMLNNHIDTIVVRRADMFRVVAYAKKTKLVPLFADWNLVLTDQQDCDEGHHIEQQLSEEQSQQQQQPVDSVANTTIVNLLRNNFLGRKGGVIEQLKKARTFFELKEIMEPLKRQGYITDYGKYASAENPEECYLVIYDAAGNIKALLGKGDESRPNLSTGQDDSLTNYRGCGAIWFTIKE